MLTPPPEVAALARALPDSLPPEVVFGVGGGTGFGRSVCSDQVTLLTRITTRENAQEGFLADICRNLQVQYRLQVATSSVSLHRHLAAGLAEGRTPILWVEPDRLPWSGPPSTYQAVAVLHLGKTRATVFDGEDRSLPIEALLAASRMSGAKYRTLVVAGAPGDLGSAVQAGLRAHRQQMREGFGVAHTRGAFGLPGLARWAVSIEADAACGQTLADQIEGRGGGPAMREAQSAFLAFAGYERAAAAASTAGARWGELATALRGNYARPDHVRAVHDAEAEALTAIEAALRGR